MQNEGLAVQEVRYETESSNVFYTVMDPKWRPADEAPKALSDPFLRGHIIRSKPIWLLQGPYTYRKPNEAEPWVEDGPEVTDEPKIVLGCCVWPLVRFIGKRKGATGTDFEEGKEYEQWLPTKEHYFISLEHDKEAVFPAQYWREIDRPAMPLNAPRDDHYRWGTRYAGWTAHAEYEPGEPSKYLTDLRRASTDEPFSG